MTPTAQAIANPYVGPRTFTREQRHLYFGREREAPAGVTEVDNIFLFNLMLSLDQSGDNAQRLAGLSLSQFLAGLSSEDGERWAYIPTSASRPTKQASPRPYSTHAREPSHQNSLAASSQVSHTRMSAAGVRFRSGTPDSYRGAQDEYRCLDTSG